MSALQTITELYDSVQKNGGKIKCVFVIHIFFRNQLNDKVINMELLKLIDIQNKTVLDIDPTLE